MAKMITLSFKDNEMELYEHVKSKSSPSIYIKELVLRDINGTTNVKNDKDDTKNDGDSKEKNGKQNNIKLSTLKMTGR